MAATNTIDAARVLQLEKEISELRVNARALQLAVLGPSLHSIGYGWAWRKAWGEERARRRSEGEAAIAEADLSDDSILAAVATVASSSGSSVQARDVAIAVLPKVAPTDAPGRQLLIARVGAKMLELVENGKLIRVSALQGRKTSRYALAGGHLDAR